MTQTIKRDKTVPQKPADQKQTATELDEQALQKVSGGFQPCVTGKHIPTGKITC